MEVRRIILKILLWSLAAAAVAGMAAVLVADDDIIERVMWTLFAAAFAAGFALPATFMLDREKPRPAGLFAMVFVTIEFLLILALIWENSVFLRSHEEEIGLTFLGLLATGLTTFGVLNLIRRDEIWRHPAFFALGVCALTEFCFLVAVFCQQPWRIQSKWWLTGWYVGAFGLAAATSSIRLGFRIGPGAWRWLAVFINLAAIVIGVTEVWYQHHFWRVYSLLTTSGVFLAFLNLMFIANLRPGQGWVRLATLASALGGGLIINFIVLLEGRLSGDIEDASIRLLAASGIATACGSLAMIVLLAINRRTQMERRLVDVDGIDITVVCPRCRRKQSLPAGESSCNYCGLRFDIRIEEPTCAECGYLLTRLTSDRCPECGTPIRKPEAPVPN